MTQISKVSVTEGETANITCCWTGTFERVRVKWLKNQTEIIKGNYTNLIQSQGSEKKCSYLHFSNIKTKDSGTYICEVIVEIPSLTKVNGKGTVITVKTGNDTSISNTEESGK